MLKPLEALAGRAKNAGISMAEVCRLAEVAESTVSRAKAGADMKMGTYSRLSAALTQIEAARAEAR